MRDLSNQSHQPNCTSVRSCALPKMLHDLDGRYSERRYFMCCILLIRTFFILIWRYYPLINFLFIWNDKCCLKKICCAFVFLSFFVTCSFHHIPQPDLFFKWAETRFLLVAEEEEIYTSSSGLGSSIMFTNLWNDEML